MNFQQIRKELAGQLLKEVLLLEKPVYRICSFGRKEDAFLHFRLLMKYISFISLLFLSTSGSLHVMNTYANTHVYWSEWHCRIRHPLESEVKKLIRDTLQYGERGDFLVSQLWSQLCSPAAVQNCLLWLLAEVLGQGLCPPGECGTGWALLLFSLGTQAQEMHSIIYTGTISSLNAWGEMNGRTVTMPSPEQQKGWLELCLAPALLLSALCRLLLSLPLGFSPLLVPRLTMMVWAKKAKLCHFQENTKIRFTKWCSLFTGWGS